MVEELRFFLRIGVFGALIAIIYWFVSYEEAGTVLLVGIVVAAGFFVIAAALSLAPKSNTDLTPERKARSGIGRMAGIFDRYLLYEDDQDSGGEPDEAPLALDEDVFPESSIWPLTAAFAALLVGLGLVYGPWLWIPGLAVAMATTYGWVTQLHTT
ncbi:MAG: cytochrome c oxidase subunit 4 [Actinobacteria bacterium]|nr:cytochrome c oxidase subunit 4 [Actinomycetota bacterium]